MWATRLLLLSSAVTAALASPQSQLSVSLGSPEPAASLTARYVECLGIEDPSAYFPFLSWLTSNRLRAPFDYLAPELQAQLDKNGKPYSDTNPIFSRLLQPNETWRSLELNLARGRYLRNRGETELLHAAIANGQADELLKLMRNDWKEREKIVKPIEAGKTCESWIDIRGRRACSVPDFWRIIGTNQRTRAKTISLDEVTGEDLSPLPYDRLQPPVRDQGLPFFVLYASTNDEAFPNLFDELNYLAGGGAEGGPFRAQFTVRWKPDTRVPGEANAVGAFGVKLGLKGVSAIEDRDATETRHRIINNLDIEHAWESLVSFVVNSPLAGPQLPDTIVHDFRAEVESQTLTESITINGVSLDLNRLDLIQFVHFLRRERELLADIESLHRDLRFAHAREILIASEVTPAEELTGRSPKNVIKPSNYQPLRVVNLVQAVQELPAMFVDLAYIESVESDGEEVTEGEEPQPDKPAHTTVYVITDLDTRKGLALAHEVLAFIDATPEIRVNFVHNPMVVDFAPHRYSFSNLLYLLIDSGNMREVFPAELLTWLSYEVDKDGLEEPIPDVWDDDNPMTPFVVHGADEAEAEAAKEYWQSVQDFALRSGIAPGNSGLVINGRVIDLQDGKFSVEQFQQVTKYEFEKRIQPILATIDEVIPTSIKEDRSAVARIYSSASSVVASSLLPIGTAMRSRPYLAIPESYPCIILQERKDHALWEIGALLDPLSANAQRWLPVLSALVSTEMTYLRLYPIASDSPRPSTLYGLAFPLEPRFDEVTMKELRPIAQFANLPSHAVVESIEVERKAIEVEAPIEVVGKEIEELNKTGIELKVKGKISDRVARAAPASPSDDLAKPKRDEL